MTQTRQAEKQVVASETPRMPFWHTPVAALIGGAMGGWVCFAFEGLKKRAQSRQQITRQSFQPKELFRGSTAFAASVGTTSVAQFSINSALHNLSGYNQDSVAWNVGTALASGMSGAFFSAAVENIVLTQQLSNAGPGAAVRTLVKQGYTRPWLGLPELMVREGGYALTMLWLADAVNKRVYDKTHSDILANAGTIGVGIGGAFLTHPADTMATYKQHHLVSTRNAYNAIISNHGLAGFYKGVGYRAVLFTSCMVVIPWIEKIAANRLSGHGLFRPKQDAPTAPVIEEAPKQASRHDM